jgi:hypothetical protein
MKDRMFLYALLIIDVLIFAHLQWATLDDPNPNKMPRDSIPQYMQYAAIAGVPLMFLFGCLLVHLVRMKHYRLLERLYGECEAHLSLAESDAGVPNGSAFGTVILDADVHEVHGFLNGALFFVLTTTSSLWLMIYLFIAFEPPLKIRNA